MAAERAEALGDEGTWAYKLSLLGFETADDVDAVLSRAGVWLARLLQRCRDVAMLGNVGAEIATVMTA